MTIIADMHTHTIVSGHAYSTLDENLRAASAKRLLFMATTEHGPCMPGAPHAYYFSNMRILPRELYGVRLIRGIEANVLNTAGELDLPERFLRNLDYVAVGLHDDCFAPASVEENTQALLTAMQNPLVDTVVHPGNPKFPLDISRLLTAAAEQGVLIEINNSSLLGSRKGSGETCGIIARMASERRMRVVLGSDAHYAGSVGELTKALNLARCAGIADEYILNLSKDAVEQFVEQRRQRKQTARKVPIK